MTSALQYARRGRLRFRRRQQRLYFLDRATGLVRAGNFSVAGGFVGAGEPDQCVNCMTGDGSIFNNTNFIVLSTASGNVSVGENSLGGGFAGAGSFIISAKQTATPPAAAIRSSAALPACTISTA